MSLTRSQRAGMATRVARADRRFRIVRDASDEGAALEEAARRAGLTPLGVRGLLRRRVGSAAWPLREAAP